MGISFGFSSRFSSQLANTQEKTTARWPTVRNATRCYWHLAGIVSVNCIGCCDPPTTTSARQLCVTSRRQMCVTSRRWLSDVTPPASAPPVGWLRTAVQQTMGMERHGSHGVLLGVLVILAVGGCHADREYTHHCQRGVEQY